MVKLAFQISEKWKKHLVKSTGTFEFLFEKKV